MKIKKIIEDQNKRLLNKFASKKQEDMQLSSRLPRQIEKQKSGSQSARNANAEISLAELLETGVLDDPKPT